MCKRKRCGALRLFRRHYRAQCAMCRTIGPEPAVTYHIIRGRRRPIGGANVRPRRMLTALLPCPLAGRANVSPSIVSSVRWGDIGHCRSYIARYEGGGLCAIQDQQEDRKVSGQSEQRPKLLAVPTSRSARSTPRCSCRQSHASW